MNRKTLAIIIGINVVLVTTIVTLYFTVWLPSRSGEEGFLTITGMQTDDVKLNITQLENLPNITQEYHLQGSEIFSANYTGVSIYYLVTQVANFARQFNAKVIAIDNYANPLSFDEINQSRDIIIAYKKNGEYLKDKSHDGEGPLRLIIPQRFPGDFNGQYCVKFVAVLEIISICGEEEFLTIAGLPTGDFKLSIHDLESLPNISREYLLQGHTTVSANYTGVSVHYLVTQIANYTENVNVKIIASDNYAYTLSLDEINQTRDIIIAYKKNGEYIDCSILDGEGPLRLIIPQRFPGDFNEQSCVKYVAVLEIIEI